MTEQTLDLVAFISIRRKNSKLDYTVDINVRNKEEALAVMKILTDTQKQVIAKSLEIAKKIK